MILCMDSKNKPISTLTMGNIVICPCISMATWPDIKIFLRADSHFSAPEVHSFCNQSSVYFLLGQGSNSVLKAQVAPLVNQAKDLFALQEDKSQTIRLFTQFSYQAE